MRKEKMKKLMAHARSSNFRKKRVGKYELSSILSTGTSSVVKLATHVDTGEEVAIKIISKKTIESIPNIIDYIERRNAITQEISIMKMVRHPNVVRIIEVMATKKKIYIVLELVSGGELFGKIVDRAGSSRMSEDEARGYFQQIICAVEYCHSKGVAHRDLKPQNLLVDNKGVVKVSDFGMSAVRKQVGQDKGLLQSACGTSCYIAPEVIRNQGRGQGYEGTKADIWSCGVILYFLAAGNLPFIRHNDDDQDLYRRITQARYTSPSFFSRSLNRLIRRILDPDPSTRITINEIFQDEWFKKDYKPPRFSQDNISFDSDSEGGPSASPGIMNAFEIMFTFLGFNILGNFCCEDKREARFTTEAASAEEITAGIEHVSGTLGFSIERISNSKMTITSKVAGRKGHLSIATKIRVLALPYHLVEFFKTGGDTLEFHKFYKDISAGLQDIIKHEEPIDTVRETDGAGPGTSSAGPSTSTAGPSTSSAGPSTSSAGPSKSTEGPSSSTEGPSKSTARRHGKSIAT